MGHHRAARTGSRRRTTDAATPVAGKRRATPPPVVGGSHSGSRGALFRGLPPLPIVAGVATLAIALGGAAQLSAPGLTPTAAAAHTQHPHASALSGSSASAAVDLLSSRSTIVSRSAGRGGQSDAQPSKQQQVEEQNEERTQALTQFRSQVAKQAKRIRLNAWELPITAGVYHLSAGFGAASYLWSHLHTGLDFAAPIGTPIHAVAGGVVTEVGYDGAYGNKTVVTLEDGTEIWYCHQNSLAVNVGDVLRSGDLVGYVGNTGNTTGPHLHLEVRPGGGDPVDPFNALVANGVQP